MAVPLLIFLACFGGSITAASRWLPPLPDGLLPGLAFFLVCGLFGAAGGLIGLNVYTIVRQAEEAGGLHGFTTEGYVLAAGLRSLLYESGTVAGLAGLIYLLAARSPRGQSAAE